MHFSFDQVLHYLYNDNSEFSMASSSHLKQITNMHDAFQKGVFTLSGDKEINALYCTRHRSLVFACMIFLLPRLCPKTHSILFKYKFCFVVRLFLTKHTRSRNYHYPIDR